MYRSRYGSRISVRKGPDLKIVPLSGRQLFTFGPETPKFEFLCQKEQNCEDIPVASVVPGLKAYSH